MPDFGISTTILAGLAAYSLIAFIFTVNRPEYGLYFSIPIIGLGFGNTLLTKGLFVALMAFAIVINIFSTGKKQIIKKEVLVLLLLIFLFILWVLFRGMLGDEGLSFWLFWVIKRLAIPACIILASIFLLRTKKALYRFSYILSGFAVVTAVIGILQYFTHFQIFWSLREALGVPPDVAYQIFGKIRIVGLAAFVVPLSYQLLSVFPITLSFCALHFKNNSRRLLLVLVSGIIFFCLILTFMKAGIGAAVLGAFAVAILFFRFRIIKLKSWSLFFIILALFSLISFTIFNQKVRDQVFVLGDTSYERIPVAIAAVKVIGAHPFGVGYEYQEKVKEIYPSIEHLRGARIALVQFPHDLILNISTILGLPATIIMILFYILLFKELLNVLRNGDREIKILAIGLIGSFIAYIANAFFHNNNPFFGDVFNWLLIGLALALINYFSEKSSLPAKQSFIANRDSI